MSARPATAALTAALRDVPELGRAARRVREGASRGAQALPDRVERRLRHRSERRRPRPDQRGDLRPHHQRGVAAHRRDRRRPTSPPKSIGRLAKAALADAQFAPEVLSRIDDVFAFRPLKGLDIARVVALEIEAHRAAIRPGDRRRRHRSADPARAIDALSGRMQGGVRDIARAIERQITDGLIEARSAGAAEIRLIQDGDKVCVETVRGSREQPAPNVQRAMARQ